MKYMEYFKLEIMIENYLNDIEGYSDAAYQYLMGNEKIDKDEMIMYLSSVSECIDTVKDCIIQLEETYEKEIKDLNEQLQQVDE